MAVVRKEYTNSFTANRVENIHDVIAAFFCALPEGEYTLERTERFRMTFRRGEWVRSSSGEPVPNQTLPRTWIWSYGTLSHWPMTLCVLLRPAQQGFLITVRHELSTRSDCPGKTVRGFGVECQKEATGLEQYLAQVKDTSGFPPGEVKIEAPGLEFTPVVEPAPVPKTDTVPQPSRIQSAASIPGPPSPPSVAPSAGNGPVPSCPQHAPAKKALSAWWPASGGGTAVLVLLLLAAAGGGTMRGGPGAGVVSAGLWYLGVILVRYLTVVRPSKRLVR